jgi:hypothetical protein
MTARDGTRFLALLFVALALAPSAAHLLELPNKIDLAREQYFVVQQIYRAGRCSASWWRGARGGARAPHPGPWPQERVQARACRAPSQPCSTWARSALLLCVLRARTTKEIR